MTEQEEKKWRVILERPEYTDIMVKAMTVEEAEKKAKEIIENNKRYENYKIAGIEQIQEKKEDDK